MASASGGRGQVGWGIVGFGWVARDYMAPAILAAGDRVLAVCDPSPDARARAAALGAEAFERIEDMLADQRIEAVYVATPNDRHRTAVEAAAQAGKAVLCEKPMAATLADAEAMVLACRRAGVLFGTAFDQRHHPAHLAMREAIGAGRLGKVTAVRVVYACWVGPDWSACAGTENWRVDPVRAGGGALIDLAPHGLDLFEFLVGEPVAEVHALVQHRVHDYPVDDGAMIMGASANGVLLSLHVAYNTPEGLPRRRLEIVGTRGQINATDTMGQDPGGTLTLTDGASGETASIAFAGTSPFLNQARAFAEALRGTGENGFSPERDLNTMRLVARAYAGEPVSSSSSILHASLT